MSKDIPVITRSFDGLNDQPPNATYASAPVAATPKRSLISGMLTFIKAHTVAIIIVVVMLVAIGLGIYYYKNVMNKSKFTNPPPAPAKSAQPKPQVFDTACKPPQTSAVAKPSNTDTSADAQTDNEPRVTEVQTDVQSKDV